MFRTKLTITAALAVLLIVGAAAPGQADLTTSAPIYLSLGDSWAYGQGADDPATEGYTAQLHEALVSGFDCSPSASENAADGCSRLELIALGRPATATLPGVTAPLVETEQLPVAIELLQRNHDQNPVNDVEVITLHVGGNDVSGPIQFACLTGSQEQCIATFKAEMSAFAGDLYRLVGRLRAAAGPGTPIVLGTYDNPVPYCNLAPVPGAIGLGAMVLEGSPDGAIPGVHDIIRQVAADNGAVVAESFGDLGQGDFAGGDDCLHPTSAGYDHVTDAFIEALGI
jgi:lysophospholipase L1-like esterase